jgi:glycine betaine transporter
MPNTKRSDFSTSITPFSNSLNAMIICGVMLVLLAFSLFLPKASLALVEGLNRWIFAYFDAGFLWVGLLALGLNLLLVFAPFGRIRLGGEDASPKHSLFDWVAMQFAAGMGVALILWGGAEPLFHLVHPITTAGLGNTTIALKEALAFSYLHWSFHPWALYTLSTVATAYYVFNRQHRMAFDAIMLPHAIQHNPRWKPFLGSIHLLVLLTFIGGVAVSFAVGALQVEHGIAQLWTGNDASQWPRWVHLITVGFCYVCYMASSLGGLGKGIKQLSQWGVVLNVLLFVWIAYAGWQYLHPETLGTSLVHYVQQLIPMSLGKVSYVDSSWPRLWTVKTWAFWLSWAPFMGMFGALISRGRTIREVALGMTLIPAAGSILWFWVVGEVTMRLQQATTFMGSSPGWDVMGSVIYRMLEALGSPAIIIVGTIITIALFFINSADSATYSLATLGDDTLLHPGREPDAPRPAMQFMWGTALAVLALAMLFVGKLQFLQELIVVLAFPYLFLYTAMILRLGKATLCSFLQKGDEV